jgi:tetratricopeptide (TPR) repeat protein
MNLERLAKLLQMLEENKEDTFLTYAIAMEYLGDADTENSLLWFGKTLEINDAHLPAMYQLALLHSALGQTETACSYLEKGLILLKESKDIKTRNEFRSLLDELLF